ncbi:MAG: hypothetical protein Q9P14_19425 [candidate division KSB1 bacterium]|nr:hypothetical protein [candidate division KSB1 bacterium]MDQ7065490.1 hypothetical protein [candidate division KSB1 bacterium]
MPPEKNGSCVKAHPGQRIKNKRKSQTEIFRPLRMPLSWISWHRFRCAAHANRSDTEKPSSLFSLWRSSNSVHRRFENAFSHETLFGKKKSAGFRHAQSGSQFQIQVGWMPKFWQ